MKPLSLAAASFAVIVITAHAVEKDVGSTRAQVTDLIVLYDYASDPVVVDSDTAIRIVEAGAKTPEERTFLERAGNPAKSRHLLRERLGAEVMERIGLNSPRAILDRYVILQYASELEANAALEQLRRDRSVISVERDAPLDLSVTPTDPLYAPVASPFNYQWGMHSLGISAAWDLARGHAYVGHVDNGVMTAHPDLTLNFHSQFVFDAYGGTSAEETVVSGSFRGHGSHTAGLIAANTRITVQSGFPSPPSAIGGVGTCLYCSLLVAKVSRTANPYLTTSAVISGIGWAVDAGAQVINMSFGAEPTSLDYPNCSTNPNSAWCNAISWATSRDVVLVAAAGNNMNTTLNYPAFDSRVIAVGATQSYAGTRGFLWTEETPQPAYLFRGSSTGPGMDTHGVIAPGRDVLSSVYTGANWNQFTRCGDNGLGSTAGPGYGVCTGTSMSTAHVSGLVGIMRSANPLLSAATIRTKLFTNSNNASAPNQTLGYGVPNAFNAVNSAVTSSNRLTPLFAFQGAINHDLFYTTAPQMGTAAIQGTLRPFVVAAQNWYGSVGTTVPGISVFPGTNAAAKAEAWIFTTHVNPFLPSVDLKPLIRLSWKCGDPNPSGGSVCSTYPNHVDHFYSIAISEANSYVTGAGYRIDGIEGYVYPYGFTQPPGTEALIRAYKPAEDDWAIFPQSLQSSMATAGYTSFVSTLGYVYKNNGVRPTY